ncbi:CRISPR system precrRNA processing endoribonuclease RAMP protein Cas6 [Deinococcus indicus]|uniref:CRISPR system precrRNA processing endoribonuclease RAMP protein Cas6 n=1 Tax=Deinococcus indicus TaxID=223556 RepID=UPI00174AD7E9|nr:CRISPR system precrRNA processing endoribonuclease RAMP protein Cas6 [Deinococcus indicus]
MPALVEVTLHVLSARPGGLLGVPLHGLLFSALERVNAALSERLHAAEVKGFRIGQSRWEETASGAHLTFQVGVLDDSLLGPLLEALTVGRTHGSEATTLRGEVLAAQITAQESYGDLYARHASDVSGRDLHFTFLTPTTFRTTDLDMPFPVPKTVYYGLQRRWEAFSDLHFGAELTNWVGRAVRVRDYRLKPRTVQFKGARGSAMTASLGEVHYVIARPGDAEPTFVRLLTEFANYAGVGYKTTFGLGHVETWGWHDHLQAAAGQTAGIDPD